MDEPASQYSDTWLLDAAAAAAATVDAFNTIGDDREPLIAKDGLL